jgi:hypothetical protein
MKIKMDQTTGDAANLSVSPRVWNLLAALADEDGYCGAGVSPAIFLLLTRCKNAGETPAPRKTCTPS